MADIVGPTLEQLDNWGTLDSLPYSLDSSIWLTAALREGESSPATSSSVSAAGFIIKIAGAAASTSVAATSSGIRLVTGASSLSVLSSASASGGIVVLGASSLSTLASIVARGGTLVFGSADLGVFAIIPDAKGNFETFADNISMAPVATGVVEAERLGELWGVIPDEGEVWSEVADEGETWTIVSDENEGWNWQ